MEPKTTHPQFEQLVDDYHNKKIDRRQFLRFSALLGVSAGVVAQGVGTFLPRRLDAATIQRGGVLRVAAPVQKVTHPAQFSWIAPSIQLRQVAEYLTYTDENNITHPYLLKDWAPSEDLKTWTLNLREGVTFNNGDDFSADDVLFSMNQWLDQDVGSSIKGLLGDYLDPTGIEKVGPLQVRLHLKRPEIAVPEHLFHYPALILNHRTFEGDFIKKPHGTGPFTLEYYGEGERCEVKARAGYWLKGADGQPKPYLDRVVFLDMGTEMAPQIAAIKSGEIDMIDLSDAAGTDVYQALKDDPQILVQPVTTSTTRVLRMRVDMKPWSDNRVRQALKCCQHREKLLSLCYFGQGLPGQDFHTYPKHPAYCEKPIPPYDPERAKQLLADAGYGSGLDVNLAVATDWSDVVRLAEILKQDAAPAGFRINIQTMPASQYWEKWTEVDLGVTPWTHRPLGTMLLNLAYTADDTGKPVAWNETRWVDQEFSALLKQANATVDATERRKIFCKLEDIQMERGSVGISYWRNVWMVTRARVQGAVAHPNLYFMAKDLWVKGS